MNARSTRRKTAVATVALLVVGGGAAYAYWTVGGSGTGTAATGTTSDITVVQTADVSGLAPGAAAVPLKGTFTNPNSGSVYVSTVTVSIDQVIEAAGVPAGGCTAADYTLSNSTMSVNAEVPAGTSVGAWSGAIDRLQGRRDAEPGRLQGRHSQPRLHDPLTRHDRHPRPLAPGADRPSRISDGTRGLAVQGRGAGPHGRRAAIGTAIGFVLLCLAALVASEPAMALRSGPTTFTLTGTVHEAPALGFPAPTCGTGVATLAPGVTRCLEVRIDNHLGIPLVVHRLTTSLDPAYPAVPGCPSGDLMLPSLSTSVTVPARGSAATPALPILLRNTPTNQDACKRAVLHLALAGTAMQAPATPDSDALADLVVTGSDALPTGIEGLVLVAAGLLLVLLARRRRRAEQDLP